MNLKKTLLTATLSCLASFSSNHGMEGPNDQDNKNFFLGEDSDFFTYLPQPILSYLTTFVPYEEREQFIKTLLGDSSFQQCDNLKDELERIKLGKELLDACKKNNDTLWFLHNGAKVNLEDEHGNTPLMIAAEKGNQRSVITLHQFGAEINHQNNDGNTALMIAAKSGHLDVVKYLIGCNSSINLQNNDGNTALMIVAPHTTEFDPNTKPSAFDTIAQSIVTCPFKEEIDISLRNNDGKTARDLFPSNNKATIIINCIEELELYMKEALDNPENKSLALDFANSSQFQDMFLFYLGARMRARLAEQLLDWGLKNDIDGNKSALGIACLKDNLSLVKKLIDRGTNLSDPSPKDNTTPLMHVIINCHYGHAIINHYYEIAKLLLENGADPNVIDQNNDALCEAVKFGQIEMIQLLLKYGAQINNDKRNKRNISRHPLLIAAQQSRNSNNPQLFRLISNYCPLKTLTNDELTSLLIDATKRDLSAIIEQLIKEKIKLDEQDVINLLHIAQQYSYSSIAHLWLAYNEQVTQFGKEVIDFDFTLQLASSGCDLKVVTYLLKNKLADPNARKLQVDLEQKYEEEEEEENLYSFKESSPLYEAIKNNHVEVVKLLLEYGADPEQNVNNEDLLLLAADPKINIEIVELLQEALQKKKDQNK